MPAKNRTISLCPKRNHYFNRIINKKFFSPFSFLVNVANLKSLIGTCQCLVVGEDSLTGLTDHHGPSGRRPELPPQEFCSIVFKLIALQVNMFTKKTYFLEFQKDF